mmetsp:Transcript_15081/g.33253  ORF Transcript_15081/g.33253 Transcript_15081/m.33253 type:complete len:260 (+) Transcript_15081:1505-2284(+)
MCVPTSLTSDDTMEGITQFIQPHSIVSNTNTSAAICTTHANRYMRCQETPLRKPVTTAYEAKKALSSTSASIAKNFENFVTTLVCLKSSADFVSNIRAAGVERPSRSWMNRCRISRPVCWSVAMPSFCTFSAVSLATKRNSAAMMSTAPGSPLKQGKALSPEQKSPTGSSPHCLSKPSFSSARSMRLWHCTSCDSCAMRGSSTTETREGMTRPEEVRSEVSAPRICVLTLLCDASDSEPSESLESESFESLESELSISS